MPKEQYLKDFINSASRVLLCSVYLQGETYLNLREEWRKQKFLENISKEKINFEQLFKELEINFNSTIKIAKKAGDFKGDDERFHQSHKWFLKQREK